ncbi:hypothetical protein OZL92_14830 [Bacillus sonorensis]|uniref:Uncharacterized protein n=2 Tax=Bacillus sonorensis TaxID=119858 RepID=M5PDP5_9BACI|nr:MULTISPECIES: hypothetical protein [Bacillus]TWK75368.1 hypothetical protein CHCC20335_1100 [Bacillus paralicheniformis]ASB91081.1 hypothetical protein S101395_04593 [Bacillus sonorensis]EME73962.1 hypothetical protein BSONL12_13386 [Bacillus sonorensis L12]MCF7619871.1 hypothetical protein [Bacillus sonorensis]MCY7858280.1 hypothetical protein [Bacillus sonorensis]
MKHLITCTSEELALLVGLCDYPGVGKGILESSLGKKSRKEWDAIAAATVNQLILKQYWNEEKSAKDENPLSEEMQKFIVSYVNSEQMIRCSNLDNKNTLMLHHFENETWLFHMIDRDIIHEFAYADEQEIAELMKDYYHFSADEEHVPLKLRLSDKCFDWLSNKDMTEKVRKKSSFSPEEEHSFNQLIADLEANQWSLHNISHFYIPSLEDGPFLQNIVFFIPSARGVWVAQYDEHNEKPVHISLKTLEQWNQLLKGLEYTVSFQNT